jgi:hypothetical protein
VPWSPVDSVLEAFGGGREALIAGLNAKTWKFLPAAFSLAKACLFV